MAEVRQSRVSQRSQENQSAAVSRGPTTAEKIRGLPWSVASNAANTVFVQFTYFGSVFVLFLDTLGLSKGQMGFLLSLLPFAGLIALFIAPAVARFGYKRTFVTFWGARKAVTALLLLTPWVASQFGSQVTLLFVGGIVAVFAILRSVAMTAYFPWTQEYVPDTVRGKYTATNNVFTALMGFLAVSAAGFALERITGLTGYMVLVGVGVLFGFIAVWLATFIPGGDPVGEEEAERREQRNLIGAVQDRDFRLYLAGVGLITLATVPLTSFLPLFMQDQVGLSSGNVVLLQTGTLVGGLLSSYLWGWAADRYGSKPVMLSGVYFTLLLPIFWMVMPRHHDWSLYIALSIALLQGIANMGWGIGSARLLYVSVVPSEKKSDYMALYFAWAGVAGGFSQLAGGQLLDLSQGIAGQVLVFPLDPYTPLFVGGLALPAISLAVLGRIGAGDTIGMGEFAGIFFKGNPFLAMSSLIRYHLRAKGEHATVLMTERLAETKSPLTVEELLESLSDPRFNVRFEAIVSIARMPPDPRLTEALIDVLHGSELALSVVAAWALGRIGDERALQPLRGGLDSEYRSIQAHCARALGALGDVDIIPLLSQRLVSESDRGLQMAYASALGGLGATETLDQLLSLLAVTENEGARMELALTLARMIGDEHHFVQLLRQVREDAGTGASLAMSALRKKVEESHTGADVATLIEECAAVLAREDLERGIALMQTVIDQLLPRARYDEVATLILRECAKRLGEFGAARIEYLLLALHTMDVGWQS